MSDNEILKNNIKGGSGALSKGIDIDGSANTIIGNTITSFGFNGMGVGGKNNIVFANSIESCRIGFYLDGDRNFITVTLQVNP